MARYAYVAMSNVDRVATVDLGEDPHVVAGLDLRLFVNAPYGTQPSAEALSRDGKRLYVALAGLNAVAVLDAHNPAVLHRLGLIPTGSSPSALALSPDGRYLYVADARGVDGWGLLQRVDMKKLPLVKVTLSALRYNRAVAYAHPSATVPPLRSKTPQQNDRPRRLHFGRFANVRCDARRSRSRQRRAVVRFLRCRCYAEFARACEGVWLSG